MRSTQKLLNHPGKTDGNRQLQVAGQLQTTLSNGGPNLEWPTIDFFTSTSRQVRDFRVIFSGLFPLVTMAHRMH